MKKWLPFTAFFAAVLLVFTTVACSDGNDDGQELVAPTNISVVASEKTKNAVTVTWSAVDNENVTYYWIYYSTTNDTSTLTTPQVKAIKNIYVYNGKGSYDITLTETNTYYFWVKAAEDYASENTSDFSAVTSYAFTYETLAVPTNVSVQASETTNRVTVTWTATDAKYYWIYYSTTNNTSTLTTPVARAIAGIYVYNGKGSCDVTLTENNTYYFWVRSADDYTSDTPSDFSEPANYTFTYTTLTVPTNVSASASETKNSVRVTWTATGAYYYWIYYSTTNDTTTLATPAARAIAGIYVSNGNGHYDVPLTKSDTYYFWVRSADDYASDKPSDFSSSATYTFTYTE